MAESPKVLESHAPSTPERRGFPTEIVLLLCGLGVLAAQISQRDPPAWDVSILLWVHQHSSPALDQLALLLGKVGAGFGITPFSVLFGGWLLWRRRGRPALFFALSMLGAWALEHAGKALLARHRPSLWISAAPERWFGFPSGHALAAMALATALTILAWPTRARWWVAVCSASFVLLVSASRVYLGVHYPSDVLGGWLTALAWVLTLQRLLLAASASSTSPTPGASSDR